MIKKNPRPRVGCATAPGRDPIDPRPDRSIEPLARHDRGRAREHCATNARESNARKTNRTTTRVYRSSTPSRRRRHAAVSTRTPPAKPYPESGGLQNSVNLTSNYSSNTMTLAVSVATRKRTNETRRATDGCRRRATRPRFRGDRARKKVNPNSARTSSSQPSWRKP